MMKRKTFCLFLLILFILGSHTITYAQGNKITLKCKNMALPAALTEVEQQSNYYKVNYNHSSLSNFKVTKDIKNLSAVDAVKLLIEGLPFVSSVKGNFIQISKKKLENSQWNASNNTIHGRLLDSTGEPLVGASVKVEGSKNGTITDADGYYTLTGVNANDVIEYSYVGMKTYRKKANSKSVNIILEDDTHTLDNVIVTGMQKVDRRTFTGAATTINANDAKIDGVADISRSLEGRAAGVSVQNVSGTFGTAPKIRVRGATSIYGSSKPLWVVDGVIMEDVTEVDADELSSGDAETLISSAIAGLNADDIESFQILKDGSATSIYGARAMAGVIVVTTKKGKSGTNHISYTGEYTMRLVPSYRDFNIMNSQEQMGVYKEMKDKGWLNFSDTYRASESGVYGKMYQLMNTYDEKSGTFALENTYYGMNKYLRMAEFRNTNWFDELFSNSVMHNHSISFSSGTSKMSTYASLSAMLDPGWYKMSKVNRYTANINTTYYVSDRFSINFIGNASYRKQKAPGTLSQSVDPVFGTVKRDFDINPYSYALNSSRTLDPNEFYTRNYATFNILHELENNYMDLDVADMKFQGEIKYRPLAGIEFTLLGAAKYSQTSQAHHITEYSNQAIAYRSMADATIRDSNPFLYSDPDDPYSLPISVLPEGGIYQKTTYKMNGYDLRITGNWNHTYNRKHIINLFGGTEINKTDRNRDYFNGWGMQYSKGEMPYYVYEYFKRTIEENVDYYSLSNTRSRSVAFFANATYSYKSRYNLNGTLRYEGTNRLGKNRSSRWLPTWNISGSWNAHEEEWFDDFFKGKVSHLTLKASYSLTGDPGPSSVSNSSMLLRSYRPYRPFTTIQESGVELVDLPNDELTYEKKHEFNLGVDVGFIKNRINFSIDWYKRNNYDLIGVIRTTGVGGQIEKLANVASMKSSGVEFTLSTLNIQAKDFKWNTNLIFSYAKNEVSDLQSNASVIDVVSGSGFALQGYPVRSLFSYNFQGLTSDGIPIFINQDGNITSSGVDINFQSQDLTHLVYEGPTDPTTTGSLGNIFTWKNFKLNLFVTYSFGNVIRLDPIFSSSYSDLDAMPREFKNRWVKSGDENITRIPMILSKRQASLDPYYETLYNAYNYSTARIAKGDFIRMKEISLSYDFSQNVLEMLQITNMSLKLQATNLFLIYADKKLNGQDPEFFRSGGVSAPMPKQFTLTLRLSL